MRKFGLAVAMIGVLAACDDDQAQKKCDTLVATLCESLVQCADEAGLEASRRECEAYFQENAGCKGAKGVGKRYDACLEDASNLDCDSANEVTASGDWGAPTSCQDVITH